MNVTTVEKENTTPKMVLVCEGMEGSAILSGLVTLLSQGSAHQATLIMTAIALSHGHSSKEEGLKCLETVLKEALPCAMHSPKQEQELFAPIPGMICNMLRAGSLKDFVIKR